MTGLLLQSWPLSWPLRDWASERRSVSFSLPRFYLFYLCLLPPSLSPHPFISQSLSLRIYIYIFFTLSFQWSAFQIKNSFFSKSVCVCAGSPWGMGCMLTFSMYVISELFFRKKKIHISPARKEHSHDFIIVKTESKHVYWVVNRNFFFLRMLWQDFISGFYVWFHTNL